MAVTEDFFNFILDQLSDFEGIETKKMFGGIGFFKEGLMFGLIGREQFRLKVDDENKKEFENRGMKPDISKGKKKGMPYWEVPVEVLEDKNEMTKWATKAYEAALRAKK